MAFVSKGTPRIIKQLFVGIFISNPTDSISSVISLKISMSVGDKCISWGNTNCWLKGLLFCSDLKYCSYRIRWWALCWSKIRMPDFIWVRINLLSTWNANLFSSIFNSDSNDCGVFSPSGRAVFMSSWISSKIASQCFPLEDVLFNKDLFWIALFCCSNGLKFGSTSMFGVFIVLSFEVMGTW